MAPQQKGFSWSNIGVGAIMNMFEVRWTRGRARRQHKSVGQLTCCAPTQVTTLGQPLEVVKTQMASNRKQTMAQALKTVASRGGALGFYQGLIPWVSRVRAGAAGCKQAH